MSDDKSLSGAVWLACGCSQVPCICISVADLTPGAAAVAPLLAIADEFEGRVLGEVTPVDIEGLALDHEREQRARLSREGVVFGNEKVALRKTIATAYGAGLGAAAKLRSEAAKTPGQGGNSSVPPNPHPSPVGSPGETGTTPYDPVARKAKAERLEREMGLAEAPRCAGCGALTEESPCICTPATAEAPNYVEQARSFFAKWWPGSDACSDEPAVQGLAKALAEVAGLSRDRNDARPIAVLERVQAWLQENGDCAGHEYGLVEMCEAAVKADRLSRPEAQLHYACGGGVAGCTNRAASHGPCASCVAVLAEAERQALVSVWSWARKARCPDGCEERRADYNGVVAHDDDCDFGNALATVDRLRRERAQTDNPGSLRRPGSPGEGLVGAETGTDPTHEGRAAAAVDLTPRSSDNAAGLLQRLLWLRDTVGVDIERMFARAQKEKDGR